MFFILRIRCHQLRVPRLWSQGRKLRAKRKWWNYANSWLSHYSTATLTTPNRKRIVWERTCVDDNVGWRVIALTSCGSSFALCRLIRADFGTLRINSPCFSWREAAKPRLPGNAKTQNQCRDPSDVFVTKSLSSQVYVEKQRYNEFKVFRGHTILSKVGRYLGFRPLKPKPRWPCI